MSGSIAPHGTRACYVSSCRRPECVKANAEYYQQWQASVPALEPGDPRHGSINGYANYRCRCRRCTDANTGKSRTRRARLQGLA